MIQLFGVGDATAMLDGTVEVLVVLRVDALKAAPDHQRPGNVSTQMCYLNLDPPRRTKVNCCDVNRHFTVSCGVVTAVSDIVFPV
jgi:hypothetical protein